MPTTTTNGSASGITAAAGQVHDIKRVTLGGALVNLVLAGAKMMVGVLGQSQALVADGIHSLSDLASDVLVFFASKHGRRAPDLDHPYGHARIETAATVALGGLLMLVAIGIAGDAAKRLWAPDSFPMPSFSVLAMVCISILAKEGLYHYTQLIANRVGSDLLRANAWHHRSDAASSIIVLVALAGALAGWRWLDAVGAIGVALMIAWMGWSLAWRSVRELVDTGLEPEQVSEIEATILAVDGVQALHRLRTRRMGGKAFADVHILLKDPRISVSEGHQISETVLGKVEALGHVADVTVHIDPEDDEMVATNRSLPLRRNLVARLQGHWSGLEAVRHISAIRLHYLGNQVQVEVFLPLRFGRDPERVAELRAELGRAAEAEPDIGAVTVFFG